MNATGEFSRWRYSRGKQYFGALCGCKLIAAVKRNRQVLQRRSRVWLEHPRDVVHLHHFDEMLSRHVALRTSERRRDGSRAHFFRERQLGNVAGTVLGRKVIMSHFARSKSEPPVSTVSFLRANAGDAPASASRATALCERQSVVKNSGCSIGR